MQMLSRQSPAVFATHRLRHVTLDYLWVASVLWLIWIVMSMLPLPPNDLWWHMAAGRIMINEGAWLQTNRWAYTLPYDARYVYQSWLSELTMYALWWLGDVPLLSLARTLAIVGSYGFVAWHALRRCGNGIAVALALMVASFASLDNWTLRPQTLALIPAAVIVVVTSEYLHGRMRARWLAAIPIGMLFWVNMHGSFIMGAALLGLVWLSAAVAVLRSTPDARRAAVRQLGVWTAVGFATFIAVLLNPLGFGIFAYVRMMLSNTSLQTSFMEWQPPRNTFGVLRSGFWFFAILLGLAALMAKSARRPSMVDVLWYCGMAWLAIGGSRYIMWFALITMPLLAEQLAALFRPRAQPSSKPAVTLLYGALLGGIMIATLPWFMPARFFGPEAAGAFASTGPYRMLLSSKNPIAATEWLAEHPIKGRFWTDMSYTSYTIWRMPEQQIFADLRVELFPPSIWKQYNDIARGDEQSVAMLDQWNITHVMLDRDWEQALLERLRQTPGWCERFAEGDAVVLARCR
jgi:hypothetical protein